MVLKGMAVRSAAETEAIRKSEARSVRMGIGIRAWEGPASSLFRRSRVHADDPGSDAGEDLPRDGAGLRRDFIDADVCPEHLDLVALGNIAATDIHHELVHGHAAKQREALAANESLRTI